MYTHSFFYVILAAGVIALLALAYHGAVIALAYLNSLGIENSMVLFGAVIIGLIITLLSWAGSIRKDKQ